MTRGFPFALHPLPAAGCGTQSGSRLPQSKEGSGLPGLWIKREVVPLLSQKFHQLRIDEEFLASEDRSWSIGRQRRQVKETCRKNDDFATRLGDMLLRATGFRNVFRFPAFCDMIALG